MPKKLPMSEDNKENNKSEDEIVEHSTSEDELEEGELIVHANSEEEGENEGVEYESSEGEEEYPSDEEKEILPEKLENVETLFSLSGTYSSNNTSDVIKNLNAIVKELCSILTITDPKTHNNLAKQLLLLFPGA